VALDVVQKGLRESVCFRKSNFVKLHINNKYRFVIA
jgi:hypothetical protein